MKRSDDFNKYNNYNKELVIQDVIDSLRESDNKKAKKLVDTYDIKIEDIYAKTQTKEILIKLFSNKEYFQHNIEVYNLKNKNTKQIIRTLALLHIPCMLFISCITFFSTLTNENELTTLCILSIVNIISIYTLYCTNLEFREARRKLKANKKLIEISTINLNKLQIENKK